MCEATEVLAPHGSGCGFNNQLFWSQTSCTDPESGEIGMYAVRGSPYAGIIQECRTDLTEELGVRCCSEMCASP